ncbi:MAG TPA: 30S ribosomal protein S20 [Patescibacteria group bacterium]|nr:30S ribosomal protein S20 [Patescibacteria group bacterium]
MPRVQAALKALRQTKKRTAQNKQVKSQLTALIRKVRKSIAAKDQTLAQKWLKETIKRLDQAAQKKVIKKNTAARKKSRLARRVNALLAGKG